MNNLQKIGGAAALTNGVAYIVGLGLVFTLLGPVVAAPPEQYVAALADNQAFLYLWHLMIYLVAGVTLVPLALALHERLKDGSPVLMLNATAFGLIWAVTVISSGMIIINDQRVITELYANDPAQATTVWIALSAVEHGLGGALELPGGLWMLLVSWAALRSGALPRALNYLGVVVGAAGLATVVPALYTAGYLFGLGAILWFLWVGIILLRGSSREAAYRAASLSA